ncbi:ACT domain-containing protein [Glaesserella parasuis]|uniref:ACT domain-containing protein n=1 Tax=Glaesserella parasuis TaxID=738 RepID=UPI001365FCB0|nr:ACT domain-containing protein [Glaesserella parasuis]MCT8574326.1 ACT domain-containing protein [Glaesserella parasuis]MCT8655315.1 ACT domain-containing protein [Glaesserella parasuis]MCT8836992.1 ACT domain-containing protein [Glaesserella parasuis]MDE3996099.1 ACT domain-containing protein [Glaesserella parasuis]MDE4013761.1 ACT domain-containing protein [Glaesserella parasuis]
MTLPINNLNELLRTMTPYLNEGIYLFATVEPDTAIPLLEIISSIQEQEGLSIVISEQTAQKYQLNAQFRAAWITLTVHSDLAAVGLTAAFAAALGQAQISCNVVAGNYHDHIFVPYEQADLAMSVLKKLQQDAAIK